MKRVILIFIFGLFLLNLTSAEVQNLGSIKQNSCVNLVQSYENSTFTNLTKVQLPDRSIIYIGKLMENHGGLYNYSFCNTSQLGSYIAGTCTDVDGANPCISADYNFDITADGNAAQQVPIQMIILALGFVLAIVGLYIDKVRIITYLGAIIVMIMGVITLYPGYSYINNTTLFGLLLGTVSIGFGFYFLLHDYLSNENQEEHPDAYD